MTTPDLSSNVGKFGSIRFGSSPVSVNVRIMDFRIAYGNPRYLITPVSGTGSQWVSAERVQFVNEFEKQ